MHQLIAGSRNVDHVDGNGLNNRRSNLRPATKSQNGANARKNPGKTSRYKGVFWDRERSAWQAKIMVNRKALSLGRFASEEDAALAYDLAAREAFGEFALTNFQPLDPVALADWRARREAESAAVSAQGVRKISASKQEWWKARPLVTHVCKGCGAEFQSNAVRVFYCSGKCKQQDYSRQERERQQEGRLF
jgi:predicted Zn-ribbon and HTH transcriptional regulator